MYRINQAVSIEKLLEISPMAFCYGHFYGININQL